VIVDTSAVVAILVREPGFEKLVEKLSDAPLALISSVTLVETGIVLERGFKVNATSLLLRFLQEFGVETIPFSDAFWLQAINAYRRYGQGRHPAGLNFGDCMTYAAVRLTGQPLLCRGDDFSKTDLELVAV
jgi:ribonuclease VapC